MKNRIDRNKSNTLTKGTFWASIMFYVLVAFEFFYMASPFAAYFYSIYGPGLNLLGDSQTANWLISFFLPHIVAQTTSPLVNLHNLAGAFLAISGICGFAIGAYQIYANKLRKGEMIQGGIYRWIRHPQYLALMVASFGMLLLWPRFLVLFGFITVMFAYIFLARAEERLCTHLFSGYAEYAQRTGMFLPRIMEMPFRLVSLPDSRLWRAIAWIFLYITVLGMATVAARVVQAHAIDSLYAYYTEDAAYLSVGKLPSHEIASLASIALTNPTVIAAIRAADENENARFINYVLPTQMFVSEIPMHLPDGIVTGHTFPENHDRNRYKIVFTVIDYRPGSIPNGSSIIAATLNKTPVIEVWIDRATARVTKTFLPPASAFYEGMPVPVF